MNRAENTMSKPGQPKVCVYFNTDGGCRFGDLCRFVHTRKCYFHTIDECRNGEDCLFIHDVPDGDEEVTCSVSWCQRHALERKDGGVCRTCQSVSTMSGSAVPAVSDDDDASKPCMNRDCDRMVPINHRLCNDCFQQHKYRLRWTCGKCGGTIPFGARCGCSNEH